MARDNEQWKIRQRINIINQEIQNRQRIYSARQGEIDALNFQRSERLARWIARRQEPEEYIPMLRRIIPIRNNHEIQLGEIHLTATLWRRLSQDDTLNVDWGDIGREIGKFVHDPVNKQIERIAQTMQLEPQPSTSKASQTPCKTIEISASPSVSDTQGDKEPEEIPSGEKDDNKKRSYSETSECESEYKKKKGRDPDTIVRDANTGKFLKEKKEKHKLPVITSGRRLDVKVRLSSKKKNETDESKDSIKHSTPKVNSKERREKRNDDDQQIALTSGENKRNNAQRRESEMRRSQNESLKKSKQ